MNTLKKLPARLLLMTALTFFSTVSAGTLIASPPLGPMPICPTLPTK